MTSESAPYDVIVVGVGGMGSAEAYHLARRGKRVLGLEQFEIAHQLGSSHGLSRIIRLAYFEHPSYVPLLRRAYELWQELDNLRRNRLRHTDHAVQIADYPVARGDRGIHACVMERHRNINLDV